MLDNGFISISRKISKKGYYSDSEYVHLWVHILLSANYEPKEFLFNGKIEIAERGQFITGIKKLSKETGISKSKVERILKVFESENQIERQRTNKFSLITVMNYDKFQNAEKQNENQVRIKRESSENQVRTTKQRNKENKDNNSFDLFWSNYPRKIQKKKAELAWNKIKPSPELTEKIVASLNRQKEKWSDPQFIPHATTWLNGERWNDEVEVKPDKVAELNAMTEEQIYKRMEKSESFRYLVLTHKPQLYANYILS